MYAIKNIKTNKWVYGTDFLQSPAHQRTSLDEALTFSYLFETETAFKRRECGKDYKIVKVNLVEVEDE